MCSELAHDDALRVFTLCGHRGYVTHMAWSPCSKYLATCSADKTACVWQLNALDDTDDTCDDVHLPSTRGIVSVLSGHTDTVASVAWSPCGRYIVTGSADTTARVWLAASGRLLRKLLAHSRSIVCVAWSLCGKYIATTSSDHTARVWLCDDALANLDTSQPKRALSVLSVLSVLSGHTGLVTSVAWSPASPGLADSTVLLVTGSRDRTARIWCWGEYAPGKCIQVLRGHNDWVTSVAWATCGQYVLTSSHDKTTRVWHASTGQQVHVLRANSACVNMACLPQRTTNGSLYIATGLGDGTVRVWQHFLSGARSGTSQQVHVLRAENFLSVFNTAWSPCGAYLATSSWRITARVWTLCRWSPRTHCRFTLAARQLVLRIICAHNRLAACMANANKPPVLPLEILFLIFDFIFTNV